MKTIAEVRGNCIIDHGDDGRSHWYWQGATSGGYACLKAPDFSADASGATLSSQRGRRAVWHILTGRPIAPGQLIYASCSQKTCLNPACLKSGDRASYGRSIRAAGVWLGNVRRVLAGVRRGKQSRKITPKIAGEILHSNDNDAALAARYGVSRSTISRHRRGQHAAVGNFFAGLMR